MGIDILDFFRGELPFAKLERLAARLPPHGHYKAALADDEAVDWVAMQERVGEPPPPTLLGWSPDYQMLVATVEALRSLIAVTVAVNSEDGQVEQPTPIPRPVTAADRAANRARDTARQDRVSRLITPT